MNYIIYNKYLACNTNIQVGLQLQIVVINYLSGHDHLFCTNLHTRYVFNYTEVTRILTKLHHPNLASHKPIPDPYYKPIHSPKTFKMIATNQD